jgi:hypothetical protein
MLILWQRRLRPNPSAGLQREQSQRCSWKWFDDRSASFEQTPPIGYTSGAPAKAA